jgi:hypothetical protein
MALRLLDNSCPPGKKSAALAAGGPFARRGLDGTLDTHERRRDNLLP